MDSAQHASIPPQPKIVGRLSIVTAAVMWSTSGFFMKDPTFQGWPGVAMAFWRAVFASLVLLPAVRRPRWSPMLLPMLVSFVAMNVTFLTSMAMTEAANTVWLQYTAPVWVFLAGVFFLGEKVQRGDVLLLTLSACGVGLILVYEFGDRISPGVVYGLLSGVGYAGVVLALRQLRYFESAWLVALNHVATALVLAPFVLRLELWPAGKQWLYLAAFGMLQMGIPYLLFARGVRSVSGHEAAGIVLLEPLLVPVWVYVAHGDAPHWWTLAGGGLILTGLLVRYTRRTA